MYITPRLLNDRNQTKTNQQHFVYIDGLAQDCSNTIANALELLQSTSKPSILSMGFVIHHIEDGGRSVVHDYVITISTLPALCEENPPATGGFPAKMANAELFGVRLNKWSK